MIHIQHSNTCLAERAYIFSVLFREILGISYATSVTNTDKITLTLNDQKVIISDTFFSMAGDKWLEPSSLPKQPLYLFDCRKLRLKVNVIDLHVPVIYGKPEYKYGVNYCELGIDLIGSAFYMLSRYEEAVKFNRDKHNRFPATASLAYQEHFIKRPIVNEYIEILWACMRRLWPQIERKPRDCRMLVSHDVDSPYDYLYKTPIRLIRRMVSDVFFRHKPIKALESLRDWIKVRHKKEISDDPYYTFEYIMKLSEHHGLTSTFYFITDHSAGKIDGLYTMDNPEIRRLLRCIHERGHHIGLHASYNSYRDAVQTAKEFRILKQVCEVENIEQTKWGGRQHYLRWETPTTFCNYTSAGLDYDTSLSFADHAGFRCGICYEYPVYDVVSRKPLKLRERPLVVMECSVIGEDYMGLGSGEQAFELFQQLKKNCYQFKGDFTLLWHNDRLIDPKERELYEALL